MTRVMRRPGAPGAGGGPPSCLGRGRSRFVTRDTPCPAAGSVAAVRRRAAGTKDLPPGGVDANFSPGLTLNTL